MENFIFLALAYTQKKYSFGHNIWAITKENPVTMRGFWKFSCSSSQIIIATISE